MREPRRLGASTTLDADDVEAARPYDLSAEEREVLDTAEGYLSRGLALLQWWTRAEERDAYAERFPLVRVYNRTDSSFAFFDQVQFGSNALPVMGITEKLFYDRIDRADLDLDRAQFREFVLRYFMRISDFKEPDAYTSPTAGAATGKGLCARAAEERSGFGFEQVFYKVRSTGKVGRFPASERFKIIDLREIGERYSWIIARVRIYGFRVSLRPFGAGSPELAVTPEESSYLVLSPEFLQDRDRPAAGVAGEYGLGYAFIKNPGLDSVIAYGPGQFDGAFQLIRFRVLENGEIQSLLAFVANRPERVTRVGFDPLGWGFELANLASFGILSTFWPSRLRPRGTTIGPAIDPVLGIISALNAATGGESARAFCLSKEELERRFLLMHFKQHYHTVNGTLSTWRQFDDWLDPTSLPSWVVDGGGS